MIEQLKPCKCGKEAVEVWKDHKYYVCCTDENCEHGRITEGKQTQREARENWNKGKKEEFKDRKTFNLKNVNRYFDPQMGVEYTTADIVTVGAK